MCAECGGYDYADKERELSEHLHALRKHRMDMEKKPMHMRRSSDAAVRKEVAKSQKGYRSPVPDGR